MRWPMAIVSMHLVEDVQVATKPNAAVSTAAPTTNGHSHASTNGTSNGTVGNNLKRTADQASLEDDLIRKKGKVMEGKLIMDTDDIQVIDDEKDDGVITLD